MSHITWHHAQHIKWRRIKGRGGTFRVMAFCFPNHHYVWWSPAFLGMGDHLLPLGTLGNNSLFYFSDRIVVCDAFSSLIKLSLSQPEFSHFYPSTFSPHSTDRKWVSCRGGLSCWLGLNHDKNTKLDVQRAETKPPWLRKTIQVQFLALNFSCN